MEYKKMTVHEVAQRLGCTPGTARSRLARRGYVGIRDGENPFMKYYEVDDDFFKNSVDMVADKKAEGYLTADDLGARFGYSGTSVRHKLNDAGVMPDFISPTGLFMWKDREAFPMLEHPATETPSVPDTAIIAKDVSKNKKYTPIVDGVGAGMLAEERKKRTWVGRRGRLVSHGHVVAEGVIESVSLCGVYLKGSTIRGDLHELELCEE